MSLKCNYMKAVYNLWSYSVKIHQKTWKVSSDQIWHPYRTPEPPGSHVRLFTLSDLESVLLKWAMLIHHDNQTAAWCRVARNHSLIRSCKRERGKQGSWFSPHTWQCMLGAYDMPSHGDTVMNGWVMKRRGFDTTPTTTITAITAKHTHRQTHTHTHTRMHTNPQEDRIHYIRSPLPWEDVSMT